LNKADLIGVVSEEARISKAAAKRAVNSFLGAVAGGLSRGERVTVSGFGTFEVRKKRAKDVKVPQSDRRVHVPEHLRPAFTAGAGLKKAVRE
jgi:DNA-binding protein HU-beta